MKAKKTILALIAAAALGTVYPGATPAYTVVCSNCSDAFQQALQLAQEIAQLVELKNQTEEAIRQTEMQIKNLERLGKGLLENPAAWLRRLANLTGQLNTYRGEYNAILQVLNELYPEQAGLAELAGASGEARKEANKKYQEHYDEWSAKINQASFATFQLSARQLKDMEESGEFDAYIENLLAKPEGHMQAMEAGNALASLQIQEIRELREMVATQAQYEIMRDMKREKEDEYERENAKALFDREGAKVNAGHLQELRPGYSR